MCPAVQSPAIDRRIVITGGAGFIGSRLARHLGQQHRVWVVDNFHPQVHGEGAPPPAFPPTVEIIRGDVRDPAVVAQALAEATPHVVYHLAAETGTGQSHDEIARYCDVNVTGTARVLEAIRSAASVEQLVLASSRAIYGEGLYLDASGRRVRGLPRSSADMERGDFSVKGESGEVLEPAASDEATEPNPCSIYASTKLMQEYLVTQAAAGAAWRATILRLQNVYGPGQSLRNPYTGVLSIFCAQLLAGKTLDIYEDGQIVRDFVFVDDVVRALVAVLDHPLPHGATLNVGSGRATTILECAQQLIALIGANEDAYRMSGKFRPGDVRYALADISRVRAALRWGPRVDLAEGLGQLALWAAEASRAEAP